MRQMNGPAHVLAALATIAGLADGCAALAKPHDGHSNHGQELQRPGVGAWPALSESEIPALQSRLKSHAPIPVVVVHWPGDCNDLEESFARLFGDLRWPRADGQQRDPGDEPEGISLVPDNDAARFLKTAIEDETSLRIRMHVQGDAQSSIYGGKVFLIIGRKPREIANGRVFSSTPGCVGQ
jgi:hypothetical protein